MFFDIQILKTFLTHLAAIYCMVLPHTHTHMCGGSGCVFWPSLVSALMSEISLIIASYPPTSPTDCRVAKTQHFGLSYLIHSFRYSSHYAPGEILPNVFRL